MPIRSASGATVFFDETTWMNPFMAAGALGMVIDDFNTGSFDHGKEGFIGGGRHLDSECDRTTDRIPAGAAPNGETKSENPKEIAALR